jgi:hypothetical protein
VVLSSRRPWYKTKSTLSKKALRSYSPLEENKWLARTETLIGPADALTNLLSSAYPSAPIPIRVIQPMINPTTSKR